MTAPSATEVAKMISLAFNDGHHGTAFVAHLSEPPSGEKAASEPGQGGLVTLTRYSPSANLAGRTIEGEYLISVTAVS